MTGFSNTPANHARSSAHPSFARKFNLEEGYARLPLSFEPNRGQTDPRVQFLARGRGYTLFLTGQGAVLSMERSRPGLDLLKRPFGKRGKSPGSSVQKPNPVPRDVLRLTLLGASSRPSFEPEDLQPGVSNYFIGHDPAQWHSRIPQFGRVEVRGIYPGVDMSYYGNSQESGRLEYDFKVQSGADPGAIRIKYEGAESAQVDGAGNLQLEIGGKTVAFRAPQLYQEIGGNRKVVEGRYRIRGDREVGFEVPQYDKSKPLVIDPILDYSTYVGGSTGDDALHVKVNAAGNAYIAGFTASLDYPTTAGAYNTTPPAGGGDNAFVTELNPTGTALVYSTYVGGTTSAFGYPFDVGIDIALDGAGDAYITGYAYSTDFPTTAGAFQSVNNAAGSNSSNPFVTELNPGGTALVYSTYLGGTAYGLADGIAVGGTGNAYVCGYTVATDFPTTAGAFQAVNNSGGGYNGFVTKLNSTGTALAYSTYLGGNANDGLFDVAVQGVNAYVTGVADSTNYPVQGPYQAGNNAAGTGGNAIVTELNGSGAGLVYSTYLGGSGNPGSGIPGDEGWGIALDAGGDAYVTGNTNSANFPTTAGAYQIAINAASGGNNAFVTKLNPAGNALVYSTYLGGSSDDEGRDVALDAGNCAYVTGFTTSTNFPTTLGAFQSVNNSGGGGSNAFLTEVDSAGASLYYSSYLGGSGNDEGYGIDLDPTGAVYVTGFTSSSNFPTTAGVFQGVNNASAGGSENGFVTKFDLSDFLTPTPTPSPTPSVSPTPTPPPDTLSLSLNLLSQASGPVSIHEVIAEYPGRFSLRVYNTAGELVKVLDDNTNTQSLSTGVLDAWVSWDGTNTHGDKVASGVYVIELTGPFRTMSARIAVVK